MVLSESIKKELGYLTDKKIFVYPDLLPSTDIIFKRKNYLSTNYPKVMKISIVGTVDSELRDYYGLINQLARLDFDYELAFLGKSKDLEIVNFAKQKIKRFRYYDSFVSHEDMALEMIDTSYIITGITNDVYQSNRISGNMYDSVRFGVPLISNMRNFSLKYNHNIVLDNISMIYSYLKNSFKNDSWITDSKVAIERSLKMNVSQVADEFKYFIGAN